MNDQDLRGRRIALVIHSFDRGGSGRVAGYLARGFAEGGMAVDVLVFRAGGDVEDEVTALAGSQVTIRHFGPRGGWRPLDLAFGLPGLIRILRTTRPEVVIAAANNAALVTAIARRFAGLRGARLVLKTTNPIATSRHRGLARRIRRWGYRLAFRWADAVWTLSPEESRDMAEAFPRHASLFRDVANPYVTDAMLAVSSDPLEPAHRKRVIAVARLDRQKRLERLIAAFARVRHPGAELLILGEGKERPMLESLVAELGLDGRVAMPGHVADVASALHAADLLVLTSDYEGLPAAVLEAMAANCPVLATDCFPAARSLLSGSEECGVITDTRPEPLARQIDDRLARPRPVTLRDVAQRFSIPSGIASHVEALAALRPLGPERRTEAKVDSGLATKNDGAAGTSRSPGARAAYRLPEKFWQSKLSLPAAVTALFLICVACLVMLLVGSGWSCLTRSRAL